MTEIATFVARCFWKKRLLGSYEELLNVATKLAMLLLPPCYILFGSRSLKQHVCLCIFPSADRGSDESRRL